mmetsp:Transcript_21203/g.24405  ORF Transcript_21203/g.24405 Transcript_21203/m.24405 type:complete len:282 (-) Transcript_21203:94-939(-)
MMLRNRYKVDGQSQVEKNLILAMNEMLLLSPRTVDRTPLTITVKNASIMMPTQKLTSADHIRTRLLRTLGIDTPLARIVQAELNSFPGSHAPQHRSNTHPVTIPSPSISSRPILGGGIPFEEPLKYSRNFDDRSSCSGSISSTSTSSGRSGALKAMKKNRRRQKRIPKISVISFRDAVNVHPIPMRSEYSNRVKTRIWSDRVEIHENAARNTIEFASEGWNWRNATENDGMYTCSKTGALVHPVHCNQYYYARQQLQSMELQQSVAANEFKVEEDEYKDNQ